MKDKIVRYLKIFLILVCLEVILFNITSFRTFLGEYTVKEFNKSNFEVLEFTEDNIAKILIKDINTKVATINLELEYKEFNCVYSFDYSDETSEGYMSLPRKVYVSEDVRTHYIPCYLSGEVDYIILNIDEELQKAGAINSVTINERIPFDFNFIRVAVLFLIICVVDFFKKSPIINSNYDKENIDQEFVLLVILGVFAFLVVFINIHANKYEAYDMYNKGLVDALANKQLSLLDEPTEEFKALSDPFDVIIREQDVVSRDEDFIWDSAYYNGKFYVYFGILPVLVFFLPFFLITGNYLQCSVVCYVLSVIILILLKEILCKFYKRYFPNIPFKLLALSLICLYAGSTIFYINGAARFYEVPILSGVCCVLAGINFVFKALEKESKKYRYIFLGCLFMALSVACRPTDLLGTIIIIPYLWNEFINAIKKIKEDKKTILKCVSSIAIPYLIVAIPLMWYNYARFENILEFGANYQLTINNIKKLDYRMLTIPVGLICNLFSIPSFIPTFPFIENHNKLGIFYGFYFIENMIGGLFILAPICFTCFYVLKIRHKTESKELRKWIYALVISGMLITMISTAKAGSIGRYQFDYAWMLVLAGILIFTIIYNFLKTEEAKKILMKILCGLTVYIVIINILAGFVSEKSFFQTYSTETFFKIRNSICFWE